MSRSRSSGSYCWTRGIFIISWLKKSTSISDISVIIPNGKLSEMDILYKCKATRWKDSRCIASVFSKGRRRRGTSRSASKSSWSCMSYWRINSSIIAYIRMFNYLIYHRGYQRWRHLYLRTNGRRNSLNTWTICLLSLIWGNHIVLDSFSLNLIRK